MTDMTPVLLDETPDEIVEIPKPTPTVTRQEYAEAILTLTAHILEHGSSTSAKRLKTFLEAVFEGGEMHDLSATCQFLDDQNFNAMMNVLQGCRYYGGIYPEGTRDAVRAILNPGNNDLGL